MKRYTFLSLLLLFVLCSQSGSHASYVNDGYVVILRSQYLDQYQDITIDGVLNEDIWDKAGSLTITFTQPDNVTLKMYFTNSQNFLFFAIVATELPENQFDLLLLTFDTEADGSLVSPEDAVSINNADEVDDFYWNGEAWVEDQSPSINDFDSSLRKTSTQKTLEMRKHLTPENLPYNGFRIPNPANTFISFNVHYVETQAVNATLNVPVVFNFPTSQTNSSGFVDLKLAGAEDQDLPEFIPPETFTETATQVGTETNDNIVTFTEVAQAPFPLYPLVLAFPSMLLVKLHRKKE